MRATVSSLLTFLFLAGTFPREVSAVSLKSSPTPPILSRAEWGADEALGIAGEEEPTEPSGESPVIPSAGLSERERLCREAWERYPEEFRAGEIVTHTTTGERYAWPRTYSRKVKLLVLHHTGESEQVEHEDLSGPEQVRAIYQWHTAHNGWGDIGYHYLIDIEGVIYEGRAGGDFVIGAHAYCANTGTVGVAVLGNFRRKYPTEAQLRSVRWLLAELADRYDLPPEGFAVFHGKRLPSIAMHKDLNDTECPGRIDRLIPALRTLVARRDFTSAMLASPAPAAGPAVAGNALLPRGSTRLRLPRRGTLRLELTYDARERSVSVGSSLADVERSDPDIGLWQRRVSGKIRVRQSLVAAENVPKGKETRIELTLLAPKQEGTYRFSIGNVEYTLEVAGRR